MPALSSAIGHQAETIAEVDTRWVLAYAACLGFRPDLCLDDARPGGPVVPPTFCTGLEWMLSGDPARSRLLGLTAEERLRGVHASQDSTFHAPFRPGTRVRVTSEIRHMRRTRAGTFAASLLECRDADTGLLHVSTWSGSILRGVDCDVEAVGEMPDLGAAPALPPGAAVAELPTDRGLCHTYTECARIWNPIHTEREVALRAGLHDIILHGTATWALAARAVADAHAGGDVGRLRRLAGRFRAPVDAGATLLVRHAEVAPGVIAFAVEAGGAIAMDDGRIELSAA